MAETAAFPRRTTRDTGNTAPASVLIIDDEAAIRESLQTLLEMEDYLVTQAETAEQGLVLLAANTYDMVLLDISLPDRNGLDVLEEIRERDAALPIIMITAHGTVDNAIRAM